MTPISIPVSRDKAGAVNGTAWIGGGTPTVRGADASWRAHGPTFWPKSLWGGLSISLATAIAPLLALLFVLVSGDGERQVQNAQHNALEAARRGAAEQRAMLQQTANLLGALAQVPSVRMAGPDCHAVLRDLIGDVPQVTAITVMDAEGVAACSSREATLGLNRGDASFVQQAISLNAGHPYAVSTLASNVADDGLRIAIAVPLKPELPGGRPRGVIAAALRPEWLADLQPPISADDTATMQVLDSRDGALIARSPGGQGLVGLRFPGDAIIRAFAAAPAGGIVTAPDFDGSERIFAFAPLPDAGSGLLVAVGLSAGAVHARAEQRTIMAMGVGAGVSAMAMLLSLIFARRTLVQPLRLLAAAAARLGSGDLSSTAGLATGIAWELRAVAAGFGRMAKRLQARDRRIEALQAELAASEGNHRLLADAASDMITRFSPDLRRIYVSAACREILGYTPEELLGDKPGAVVHPEDWAYLDSTLNQPLLAGHATARATYRAFRKDGTAIWLETSGRSLGRGQGFVAVTRDVSERQALGDQLAAANRKLRVMVRQDGLTGLANRRRFDELLDEEYRRLVRGEKPMAMIMLDVDHFKRFNDTYGHPAGDRCLQAVASAIESALRRSGDVAARYGGEEFALLLPEVGLEGAMEVTGRIQEAIRAADLAHTGSEHGVVTVSMGVAVVVPCRLPAGASFLVQQADAALYRAKRAGRDRVCTALEASPTLSSSVPEDALHGLA